MMYRPTPLLSLMHRPDDYSSKSPIWLSFQAVRLKYTWRLLITSPLNSLAPVRSFVNPWARAYDWPVESDGLERKRGARQDRRI
jgi:hypothetical protein